MQRQVSHSGRNVSNRPIKERNPPRNISKRLTGPVPSIQPTHKASAVALPAAQNSHPAQTHPARQIDSRDCSGNAEQPFLSLTALEAGGGSPEPLGAGPRWEDDVLLRSCSEKNPQHIALIMDGGGRWAKERGLPPSRGHEAGVSALQNAVRCCVRWRVRALTAYAFSHENWKRPEEEVSSILSLTERTVVKELATLGRQNVRLNFVGSQAGLPQTLLEVLHWAEEYTRANDGFFLTIALNYGARQDIAAAVAKLRMGGGEEDVVQAISTHTALGVLPAEFREPDLLIRTGGEMRLSNFLLWDLAYTELYFSKTLWPDFSPKDLEAAILEYRSRIRRFGAREEVAGVVQAGN